MTLEELLNSLIEKGWYPFGRKYDAEKGGDHNTISFNYYNDIDEERGIANYSIRELVSRESGLRQFVCENGMINGKKKNHKRMKDVMFGEWWVDCQKEAPAGDYEYRLIESSLKDESELEQFLLDNILIH